MNRIEFAERRYGQIVPTPIRNWHEIPVRELGVWLRDDVAPLVGEYVGRPKFQNTANWPLRVFRARADTPARRQVDATAQALIDHARILQKTMQSRRLTKAIEALSPLECVEEEEVAITGNGPPKITRRTNCAVARVPLLVGQIETIAQPFWRDLVDPADYLEPHCGWLLREQPKTHATPGEFVVSLNPELHAIGDFVSRCLFRRVEVLVGILGEARRTILTAAQSLCRAAPMCISDVRKDAERLGDTVRQLRSVCGSDSEVTIRDSCVILTQVYLAFHPSPNTEWLNVDEKLINNGWIETGQHSLRHRFTNTRNPELSERVAAALGDLKRLFANEPPSQSALEESIARGGLVLDMSAQVAYWNRNRLEVTWTKVLWQMLAELARKRRHGGYLRERDLYPEGIGLSAMANVFSRLKKLLPADLRKHINPGPEPRSYQLLLDATQISIITPPT